MKNKFKSIFDAVVTSVIGVVTMVITLILVWTRAIDFVWQGVAGLIVGCILLMVPKSFEDFVKEGIKSWGKRAGGWFGGNNDDNREEGKPV